MKIGIIQNYYGDLEIKQENGRFFWGIEDYSGIYWEEIPEYLFQTLMRFHSESQTKEYDHFTSAESRLGIPPISD